MVRESDWASRALAAAECRVAIAGRRVAVLRDAADASEQPLWQHTVDVTDRESVQSLFAWARQELGKVDILINSAGMNIKTRTMAAMAPEQWDQVMQANATGAYNCYAGGPSRDA